MRSPQLLLLIPIFCFVVYFLVDSKANEPPTEAAGTFLRTLQTGNADAVLREFGDNTCHCAPEGGYISYLQYDSGYDPNLSFLLGKHFSVGQMKTEKLPYNGEKYVLPWDKPEDQLVYVPLTFSEKERPLFLPTDMAYGYEMTGAEVASFANNPAFQWKRAFTLRLRDSLEPGLIKARDPKAKKTSLEREAADGLLPKEIMRYLHPADAGAVKIGTKTEAATKIASELPKLKTVTIGMKVVRRGLLSRWAVKKAGFNDAILILHTGKEVALEKG